MSHQAGARWIADERRSHFSPESGQDVSASAYLPDPESQRNIATCPLRYFPGIDWTSLFRVFPYLKLEIH